ncbi:acyl-CoA thioesterase [Ornithinimicrobium sp. F0845]|uniref:acyl-CoA thioesterase n=1 Tax=Ornithinimicrobium sp. F0845 TaxID=2926412 RepID=UPI001FF1588E|nr:acyl-CoA thioesterase [Ornithinimicrobium sp. F0845]
MTADGTSDNRLDSFPVRAQVPTRWADNDMYGHLNNAVYYQLFDTVINGWLAERVGGSPADAQIQGVVAESSCRFLAEVGFPDPVIVGLRVERLGTSSVTYALGLFRDETEPVLAALGRWVHVYVDAKARRSVPIPPQIRAALTTLLATDGTSQSTEQA